MKQIKVLLVVTVVFFSLSSYKKAAPSIMGYWEIYMTMNSGRTENKRTNALMLMPGQNSSWFP